MKILNNWSTLLLLMLLTLPVSAQQKNEAYLLAMQTENWTEAVQLKQQEAQSMPSDLSTWFDLANATLAAGQTDACQKALEHILSLSPDAYYTAIATGRLALLKQQKDEAANLFNKAAKKGRKTNGVLYTIGTSYLFGAHRDLKSAEQWLKKAYNFRSKHFPTLLDLGYCYSQLSDGGQALTYYEAANRLEPRAVLPAYMVAKTYQKAKISSRYLEMLDQTLSIDPTFELALRDKAEYYYFKARDFEAAVTNYEVLLKTHPAVPVEDKMLYANSLFLAHQYPQTIDWVEKIIQEDGSKNYLRRLAAYASYESGDYEKGLSIMQNYFAQVTADKIIPEDYEYYGKLLQKNESDSLACVQFNKAIVMDSSRWELYNEIGQMQYGLGNYPEAVQAYNLRLDSVETPNAMDYYRLGAAYYAQQDSAAYEQAAATFAQVSEIAPDALIGWLMQAKTLAKLEPDLETNPDLAAQFGRAQPAFEKYVDLASADPEKNQKDLITAYEYLVYYHYVKGNADAARPVIENLLALEPENATALEISKLLNNR